MAAPAPALKDLPKVAENLKSQLEGFNTEKLKNASTQEKIILPTAEGKSWLLFLSIQKLTINIFAADVAAEKTQKSIFEGITAFDQNNLKHTETNEKNPLPDKEGACIEGEEAAGFASCFCTGKTSCWPFKAIATKCEQFNQLFLSLSLAIELEKEKNQFIAGIENFDAKKLKHTETNEKNVLPTKEVIEAEKKA